MEEDKMHNLPDQSWTWRRITVKLGTLLILAAVALAVLPAQAAPSSAHDDQQHKHTHTANPGPVDVPHKPAHTPGRPSSPVQGKPVDRAMIGAHLDDPIGMKVLVISADGTEADFPAITTFLNQIGVPYDVYQVIDSFTKDKTPLTADRLWDGDVNGYYQGIIFTTDWLGYDAGGGNYGSAFTPDEWQILSTYESTFGIRQVTFNTTGFGPDQFGLNWPTWDDTTRRLPWWQTATTPVKATLTAAGQTAIPYVNATYQIPFTFADVVLATAGTGATTLAQTSDGYALVSTYKNPVDGRENLAISADGAPWLRHSLLLSYGVINWVTRGQFLGERHVYLNPQPDDIGIADDIWNTSALTDTTGLSYRMSGGDFNSTIAWQNNIRKNANTSQFRLEWPFNGSGFTGARGDSLTSAVKKGQANFKWINHTYTHQNLDYGVVTQADIQSELTLNDNWARTQGQFTLYSKDAMIQPDISGLYNPDFFTAGYGFGIRYVTSDTSRRSPNFLDDWNNPSPNAGFYRGGNPLANSQTPINPPSLLIIPRHPSNLFYNLVTPAQWVSEYNCYYSRQQMQPGTVCAASQWKAWDNDLTYDQILDKESDILLQYLLKWDLDPLMFHQPNVGQYASSKSLLGDLINATLSKYNSIYKLPILSPSMHDIGIRMANRMAFNQSGVTALLYPCGKVVNPNITVTTANAARIPVTGVSYGTNKETYGGQSISYVDLPAGGSVSIPITCP
jgi:hypothetical protein